MQTSGSSPFVSLPAANHLPERNFFVYRRVIPGLLSAETVPVRNIKGFEMKAAASPSFPTGEKRTDF